MEYIAYNMLLYFALTIVPLFQYIRRNHLCLQNQGIYLIFCLNTSIIESIYVCLENGESTSYILRDINKKKLRQSE
jgi:hypothetical protein